MSVIWDPLDDSAPFPFDSAIVCLDYRTSAGMGWTVWDRLKVDRATTLFKLIERLTVILGQSARDPSLWDLEALPFYYEVTIRISPSIHAPADKKG